MLEYASINYKFHAWILHASLCQAEVHKDNHLQEPQDKEAEHQKGEVDWRGLTRQMSNMKDLWSGKQGVG
jgi:hypothetical protein